MREQSFFQASEEDQRKLQALGRVQGHQRDLGALVVSIGIADQRGVVEKLIESFAAVARIHGGVHQFAQILHAGVGLRRVFLLEQLDVTGAVDEKFQNLGGTGSRRERGILPAVVEASRLHVFGEATRWPLECRRDAVGAEFLGKRPEVVPEFEREVVRTEIRVDPRSARQFDICRLLDCLSGGGFSRLLGNSSVEHGARIVDDARESPSAQPVRAAAEAGA